MRLCVFEDAFVRLLEPLTLTRPAWSLRCGASTLLERQQRMLGAVEVGALVRPELYDLCRLENPGLSVNDADFLRHDDLILVNARWLPSSGLVIDKTRPHVGLVNEQIAYIVSPPATFGEEPFETLLSWLDQCRSTMPTLETSGVMIDYLWDLVDHNPETLIQDWQWFQSTPGFAGSQQGTSILGPGEKLLVAQDAVVEPFVVVDTRPGPVLIDRGAVVHSFSRLEGPCYIGKNTWIVGAKIRGGSFGPKCKIGGEVEASIIQGHSNKYHDGFLGHSYLGEWVNLAAGTQTSDLRNDYGIIRVSVDGERIATGRTKIGSFIGDHSKTGLGALLNTGSAIGVFSNLLPAGSLLPQTVPSFCQVQYGKIQENQDLQQLFSTAATVMSRRGLTFTDTHREFFQGLFDRTSAQRLRTIREIEMRQLRPRDKII
jgi:UDP-N-acetylglucosamine diphosphorylase/glucosamine-1-phosphate N-acetyltransferase